MPNRHREGPAHPKRIQVEEGVYLEYDPLVSELEYVTPTEIVRIPISRASRLGAAFTEMGRYIDQVAKALGNTPDKEDP